MGHAVPPGSILRTLSSPGEEREAGGIRERGGPLVAEPLGAPAGDRLPRNSLGCSTATCLPTLPSLALRWEGLDCPAIVA